MTMMVKSFFNENDDVYLTLGCLFKNIYIINFYIQSKIINYSAIILTKKSNCSIIALNEGIRCISFYYKL